jgi:hypothetical protein
VRHRGGAPNAAASEAAARASAASAKKAKGKGVKGISDERFIALLDEVKSMLAGGTFATATGPHFVALYADLHFRVYGVEAVDLGPKERVYASKLAGDLLEKDFRGSRDDMARFVSWTWTREKSREQWRRDHARSGGRVSWRFQFGRELLTDFRIADARAVQRPG